jgi:predicted membrane chloride channel (bestrophin family)
MPGLKNREQMSMTVTAVERWLVRKSIELTVLPMAKIVIVTWAMFLRSHKSTVWNRSTSGTP